MKKAILNCLVGHKLNEIVWTEREKGKDTHRRIFHAITRKKILTNNK